MIIEEVIAELLCVGLVAEKGRCYRSIWGIRYKLLLKKHMKALYKLQQSSSVTDEEELQRAIGEFITLCNHNRDLRRIYKYRRTELINSKRMPHYVRVDKMLDEFFQLLLCELDKVFVDKKKVHRILCVLHNLPKAYLVRGEETLCELKLKGISEKSALEYAFSNMDDEMKRIYRM